PHRQILAFSHHPAILLSLNGSAFRRIQVTQGVKEMKKNRTLLLMGLLLVAALVISACTATSGNIQQAVEQVAPTLEAAAQEVAPTIAAAATELAPTVEAAIEEVAPTVEAAATELAGGEATAEPAEEEMAFEAMSLAAPDCEYGGLFKEIAALDAMTVQFTMCAPDPAFPSKAAFTSFAIQPSEHLETVGGTPDLLEQPIGTGPYMVQNWNRGEELVFTKNPNYWGEPAFADTLVFRWQS